MTQFLKKLGYLNLDIGYYLMIGAWLLVIDLNHLQKIYILALEEFPYE